MAAEGLPYHHAFQIKPAMLATSRAFSLLRLLNSTLHYHLGHDVRQARNRPGALGVLLVGSSSFATTLSISTARAGSALLSMAAASPPGTSPSRMMAASLSLAANSLVSVLLAGFALRVVDAAKLGRLSGFLPCGVTADGHFDRGGGQMTTANGHGIQLATTAG